MSEVAAFVFPGQGSQESAAALELYHHSSEFRRVVSEAGRISGIDALSPVKSTVQTQLSVVSMAVAMARDLRQRGVEPRLVAGHSVGEYSALAVGGWLGVDEALTLVARRAEAMDRCCRSTAGAMYACIGLGYGEVSGVCGTGEVVVANRNAPRQQVISGEEVALQRVVASLEERNGTLVRLDVAGAFHSPLMAPARDELESSLASAGLRRGDIPLVSSIDGAIVEDLDVYRAALCEQVVAPVRWNEVMTSIDAAAPEGLPVVDVGPGRVLRGLFRRAHRSRPTLSCESWHDIVSAPAEIAAAGVRRPERQGVL